MRELFIIILIFICLVGLSLGIDLITKGDIRESLVNAINPFRVMEFPEMTIMFLFIMSYFGRYALTWIKKFKNKIMQNM